MRIVKKTNSTQTDLNTYIYRAMRNRGIEICLTGMWSHAMDKRALLVSRGLSDQIFQAHIINAHETISQGLECKFYFFMILIN